MRSSPEQLADFAGIAGLSDQATQSLMREIDQRDLVLALKGAVEPVREKFLGNMSERVQTFMSEEIGLVRCGPEQVLDAQVYELVEQGTIEL